MATCQFCGRQFRNTQAVRAHLKACVAYHDRDSALSRASGSNALGTVPEATSPGTEFTGEDSDRQAQREAAGERAQERADRQAERETELFLRRVAEERRTRRRRELIQSVKDQTIGAWSWQHPTIPADVKADALQQIERKLSGLPLDELPLHELVQVAEGVRDRLFRPVLEAEEAARQRARAEEEARQRAQADQEAHRRGKLEKEAAGWRDEEAARERETVKQRLVEHGMSIADRELHAEPDLASGERQDIRAWVRQELEDELCGQESNEEVEDLVDDLLAEEFDQGDEDDDEVDEFGEDEDNEDEYGLTL